MPDISIAITGSSGFVGTNFIKSNTEFSIKEIDLLVTKVSDIDFTGIDSVLHLAALVHQMKGAPEEQFYKINRDLAINVAKTAKASGVKHFIQMSTIAVYGEQTNISIHSKPNPINAYGKSKLQADEEIIKLQSESFKVTIIRPPMIYGGGNAPGNMMRLIKLVSKGYPLPFKGVNNQRDFLNIDNLVQIIELIIKKQLAGTFLLSEYNPVSTEQLINIISNELDIRNRQLKMPAFALYLLKKIKPSEYQKLFGSSVIESNFPNKDEVNWKTCREGIGEMVKWYKSISTH